MEVFLAGRQMIQLTMKLRTPVKSILPSVMGIQVEEAGKQGPSSGKSQHYFVL